MGDVARFLVTSPFTYSVIYFYQYGLKDIYFMLLVIIQYHIIYFVD